MDPIKGNLGGQQLFFANMFKARRRRTRPASPGAIPALPPQPVAHRQLVLFSLPRDLSCGLARAPRPPDAELAAALDAFAQDYGALRQWRTAYTWDVRAGIRTLLGSQDTPGAAVTTSEVAVLRTLRLPVRSICDVLAAAGMLQDDRTPAIESWFARQITGLPDPMGREVRAWFEVMMRGSAIPPRRQPRSPITIKLYLTAILPALRAWTDAGHESLRAISRSHVLAVLPAAGTPRAICGRGLRSVFGILKARKLVFADPTAGIRTWAPGSKQPLPVDLEQVRAALASPDVARAALAALVAFHGLRSGQLCDLRLSDLRDRRLHVEGRVIPLAEPVRERLAAYIDDRQARWPHTTNPHLFIHFRTAARTEPVGHRWIKLRLDLPGSVEALRQDRILHEALATGGDTRRICDLFGLSINAASRYTGAIGEPGLAGN
jgi:integrase